MNQLNPSAKLIGLLILSFALAFVHHPVLNLIVFAVAVILTVAGIIRSGGKIRTYLLTMLPVCILAAGMFFTGYRFTTASSGVVNLHAMHLQSIMHTKGGDEWMVRVWNGLIFSSRVLVYAGIGLLFAMTTDRIRMIRSFEKQLHVPQVFAYGLLAAWGLLPHMMLEYKRTKLAFRARGIRVSSFSPALIVTLLVKSTRWSEELSIAMESRGFSPEGKRSCYQPERIRAVDVVFLLITCVAFPVCAVLFFR